MNKVILASASPRRAQLLRYILADFDIESCNIDESPFSNESASDLVTRLSKAKAKAIWNLHKDCIVIGSDTVIAHRQQILGKPRDKNHFIGMMRALSKDIHHVYTGVSVMIGEQVFSELVVTEVKFCEMSETDIAQYWSSNEPQDKAGGYAIQGIGGQFVERINGSVSAVIGLPLFETKKLLQHAGVLSDS